MAVYSAIGLHANSDAACTTAADEML